MSPRGARPTFEPGRFNAETVPDLLGPEGPLAGMVPAFEDRSYQREFALEVARLLVDGGRLAVEAPTGIGKSLAYGLPAALWSQAGNGLVLVATHTKTLQDQLLRQEGPRLARIATGELRVELLKGRSNYLCRRRFEALAAEASGDGTRELLDRVRPWAEATAVGDWGEVPDLGPGERSFLETRAAGDARFCAHARCTPQDGCFFKRARARAQGANLLVVNHALLSIHLFGGQDLLPAFEALVVDEAHAFVRVALDQLTVRVGPARAATLIDASPGRHGIPELLGRGEGASRLAALHRGLARFESESRAYFGGRGGRRVSEDQRERYRDSGELEALVPRSPEALRDALGSLLADAVSLRSFVDRAREDDDASGFLLSELDRFTEDVNGFRADLEDLLGPDSRSGDRVFWKAGGDGSGFTLNAAPLELGPRLVAAVSEGPPALVFTSATLAAGADFGYFSRETGFGEALPAVAYPSPFDFEEQALFLAVRRAPDPRDPEWVDATAATLDALLRDPGRKTLALFTSYRDLVRVAERLSASAPEKGSPEAYAVLAQEPGGEPSALLDRFRRTPRAILLGTATFWEGVDLPGDDLEVLVLTRLPFGVPTEPRFAARAERLEAEGGNPFTELYVPEAVLRFKQGFGRLIRRRSDRGIVAVLDPRLLGKGYGRRFAGALPLPVAGVEDGKELARRAATWWNKGAHSSPGGSS